MRIKKLELYGFKSFPDRTSLHFGPGISCVVGPNGSGKSNVVDALRWCIGEQSARSLRGAEMADVIFAGSVDRAPVGYAEVSMVLTAEDGEPFPGDYAQHVEVQIGRRLHRSGASEYLINQVKVRRRDVVELLLDTGIGNNLYSFIQQGQVDRMVHANPMERRGIIDEAAGITRYAVRREEARQRLEATATQLDRAADVADEMGRRLRILEQQVIKAATFRALRARVRQIEIWLSLVKYSELVAERRALREALRASGGGLAGVRREVARRETDLAERQEELDAVEASAVRWRDEVAELDARRRALAEARGLHEARREELQGQHGRARTEAAEAEEAIGRGAKDLEAAEGLVRRLEEQEERERAVLSGLEEEGEAAREALRARRATVAAAEAARDRAREGLTEGRGAMAALQVQQEALPEAMRRAEAQRREAQDRWEALERQEADLREALAGAVEALEAREAERALRDRAVSEAQGVEATIGEAIEAAEQAFRAARGELERRKVAEKAAERRREQERAEALRRAERERGERLKRARLAADQAEREAWEEARGAVGAASGRAQAWQDALSQAVQEARQRREAEAREEIDGLDREGQREIQQAEAEERAAALQEEGAEEARQGRRIEALRARQAEAEVKAREAQERVGVLQATEARIEAEIAGLRDRLEGAQARLSQGQAEVEGRRVLSERLADPRPLLDVVGLDAADARALSDQVGERLLLPLADPEEVQALVDALGEEGRARVLLRTDDPVERLVQAVDLRADPEEALAHHRRTGRAVALVGGRLRIDADGVVQIGGAGAALDEAVALREQVVVLGARVKALQGEAIQRGEERARAAEALAASKQEQVEASAALEEALAQGREVLAALRTAARERLEARLTGIRQAREEALGAARRGMDARLAVGQAEDRGRLERARAQGGEAVEKVRAATEAQAARRTEEARAQWAQLQAEAEREALQAAELAQTEAAEAREQGERAVQEAEAAVAAAEEALRAQRELREAARERRRLREGEREVARAAWTEAARVRDRLSAELAGNQELARAQRARLEELDAEVARGAEEGQALEERRAALEVELHEAAAALQRSEAELAAERIALDGAIEAEEACAAQVQRVRLELATLGERRAGASRAVGELARRAEEIGARAVRERGRVQELHEAASQAQAAREEAEVALQEVSAALEEAEACLEEERGRLGGLRAGRTEAEGDLESLRQRRAILEGEVGDLERKGQEVKVEIEVLRRRMDERYQVSLPALLDRLHAGRAVPLEVDPGVQEGLTVGGRVVEGILPISLTLPMLKAAEAIGEAVEEIEGLRGRLQGLGEVNLGALEEYEGLRGRHEELSTQRADLEGSVASIRAAIAKMNRECRQRFRDAFDRVNEHFQMLYPRLVGGGSARLSLTDEEDLLETGVDIFVQPPGKRLQNLTLLSGGEKAMTAIALMISLFQVKPSPFCVLDEVDAPLDEANGTRFNEILREIANTSQFVVITHNRKTMEGADTLYGVTMANPGVSRLVSVEL